MNSHTVIRVPKSVVGRFTSMVRALGPDATPAALVALLVEYADTPEGGAWLMARYQPPPSRPKEQPHGDPISWTRPQPQGVYIDPRRAIEPTKNVGPVKSKSVDDDELDALLADVLSHR